MIAAADVGDAFDATTARNLSRKVTCTHTHTQTHKRERERDTIIEQNDMKLAHTKSFSFFVLLLILSCPPSPHNLSLSRNEEAHKVLVFVIFNRVSAARAQRLAVNYSKSDKSESGRTGWNTEWTEPRDR